MQNQILLQDGLLMLLMLTLPTDWLGPECLKYIFHWDIFGQFGHRPYQGGEGGGDGTDTVNGA